MLLMEVKMIMKEMIWPWDALLVLLHKRSLIWQNLKLSPNSKTNILAQSSSAFFTQPIFSLNRNILRNFLAFFSTNFLLVQEKRCFQLPSADLDSTTLEKCSTQLGAPKCRCNSLHNHLKIISKFSTANIQIFSASNTQPNIN